MKSLQSIVESNETMLSLVYGFGHSAHYEDGYYAAVHYHNFISEYVAEYGGNFPYSRKYTCYSDQAHGWVKVPREHLKILGIMSLISPYSYQRNGYVYLEEDMDAGIFIDTANAFGIEIRLDEKHTNRDSRIRNYPRFSNKF